MNKAVINIADLVKFIRDDLGPFYPEQELNSILFLMLEEVLGYSKTDIIIKSDSKLKIKEKIWFEQILGRLKNMEPIQYVLGSTQFYGIKILTDARTLIPRPETEELVSWILEELNTDGLRVLDIGTGSGCIAVAIKKCYPNCQVTGIDISEQALAVAQENADIHKIPINFIQGNILNATEIHKIKELDIIVSNPPYIELKEKKLMAKNILNFEPEEALFVKNNSALIFYEAVGEFAFKNLKSGGKVFFETSALYNNDVVDLLKNMGFINVESRKDINGKPRMVRAVFK